MRKEKEKKSDMTDVLHCLSAFSLTCCHPSCHVYILAMLLAALY